MMLFHPHLAGGWLQPALHREQPGCLCSGGLLLSPAGHPLHGFTAAPGLETAEGMISW